MRLRAVRKTVAVMTLLVYFVVLFLSPVHERSMTNTPEPELDASPFVCQQMPVEKRKKSSLVERHVHSHIARQCIGHLEFRNGFRTAIIEHARDTAKDSPIVVVGTAEGYELLDYTRLGLRSISFEPNPVYFDELKDMANRSHGLVDLHLCGAGEKRASEVKLTYRHAFSGCLMTLDDVIDEHVLALSIDVQASNEVKVLRGAKELLAKRGIDVIFAEYNPGDPCVELLELLADHDYFLFDFLWYGNPLSSSETLFGIYHPTDFRRKEADPAQPKSIVDYCHDALKAEGSYRWLQNDVVAIHSSFIDDDFIEFLSTATKMCGKQFLCDDMNLFLTRLNAHQANSSV